MRPDEVMGDGVRADLRTLIAMRQEARWLDLSPHGKVLATRSGGHLSRFRGRGVEFDESRVYQPGDDPRNMDWRVTARSGQAHVKLFREERERPVWLLVDGGTTMRFATRVAFKSVVAAHAAALLAWAASERGDRVGGLVFDETRHSEHRPMARTQGLLPLLKTLAEGQVEGRSDGYASLSAAARHLVHLVRPGSLVFVLSDFNGLHADDGAWLAQLGRGSEVVLAHVFDPIEAEPPPRGRYPVSDGKQWRLLDMSSEHVRDVWRRRFRARVELIDELCQKHFVHTLDLRTDRPVGESLRAGLQPRLARRHGN